MTIRPQRAPRRAALTAAIASLLAIAPVHAQPTNPVYFDDAATAPDALARARPHRLDGVQRRREGLDLNDAIIDAVRIRLRPILLTTMTTIAGLAPLLFSKSTLWPPMASAMISGLLVATCLTLLMVPALCRLMLKRA